MGASKKYFRNQFRLDKITLDHDDASDFYLASWQTGRSPVPLFCIRLIIFLGCVGILTSSLVLMEQSDMLQYWAIYLTHWGVFMITVSSGCALLVSCVAVAQGSIETDSTDTLPWYVKVYWAIYSVTVNLAFLITLFYYALLYALAEEEFAVDPVLDVFIHGINSVMMFLLLITARHPLHLLQFIYPFIFTIIYLIFSIIYYNAGGTNPQGEVWIYPMLDWSNPGPTVGMVFAVAAFLLVLHILVVGLSGLRDYLIKRCTRTDNKSGFERPRATGRGSNNDTSEIQVQVPILDSSN